MNLCTDVQVLVPPLRELETYIFERLFRYLWQKALLESVSREPSGGPLFSPHMMTPTHKASAHEDAIQRWLDALQVGFASLKSTHHFGAYFKAVCCCNYHLDMLWLLAADLSAGQTVTILLLRTNCRKQETYTC